MHLLALLMIRPCLTSEVTFNSNVEGLYKTLKKEKVTNIASAVKLFNSKFFNTELRVKYESLER
jgi:hypothetical protein